MAEAMDIDDEVVVADQDATRRLDCYPYTFTPLLLFSTEGYFDKGYSNYNSVAQFFSSVIEIDMLDNVLYDRKNMLYEELLDYITRNEMLVTCCIDAHFSAFQVIHQKGSGKPSLIYYDPLSPNIRRASGDSFRTVALFLLFKCNYGDSQHIQENKDHYTGLSVNATRREIYRLWKKINMIDNINGLLVQWETVPMNLNRHILINDPQYPQRMSTQKTSNTCYFQTFLSVFYIMSA